MKTTESFIAKAAKPAPAKARNAVFNYSRGIAFAVVQVLAALALDGWLSIALWVNAGWNVFVLAFMTFGLAQIATEAINKERQA